MKRSRINEVLTEGAAFMARHGVALPPFAHWDPEAFRTRTDIHRITGARLGWDITDYGADRFDEMGLFLFTLRNGALANLRAGRGMVYAEKLLISQADQLSPMHTHIVKTEDIINRGGAPLAIQLYGSDDQGHFAEDRGGEVICDGLARRFAPGEVLTLAPGESITLQPGDWHAFWGEGGPVLIGEVSTVNDDLTDNIFREPVGRFAQVDEDAAPLRLLVSDYATLPT